MITSRKFENKSPSLLFSLTSRTIIFLTSFLILTFVFFLIGNYQQFQDKNLELIVHVSLVTSMGVITFSIAGLIETIVIFGFILKSRITKVITYAFFMILSTLSGFVILIVLRGLELLSQGL